MKNRFVGVIIAIYPDGNEEKCYVKESKRKGKQHFLEVVCRSIIELCRVLPKCKVKTFNPRSYFVNFCHVEVKYRGDFQEKVADFMEYLKRHEKKLISISSVKEEEKLGNKGVT
jgi:hypothetical protein